MNASRICISSAFLFSVVVGRAADSLDTWTPSQPLPEGSSLLAVAYGNAQFAAVGLNGSTLTSRDGLNWATQNSGTSIRLSSVAYGGGQFAAVGYDPINWQGIVLTSTDGSNWVQRSEGVNSGGWAITYGDGQFVLAGLGGEIGGCGSPIQRSYDGTNWFVSAWGFSGSVIAYGGGQFVIFGSTTNGSSAVLTSLDGVKWVQHPTEEGYGISGAAYGNGEFVAVGNTDNAARIVSSADGINWSIRLASEQYALFDIAYGQGEFVAVGCNH